MELAENSKRTHGVEIMSDPRNMSLEIQLTYRF